MCGPGDEISEMDNGQKEEIQKLADEILKEAKSVVIDYTENPSEVSSSITHIHIDSPLLENEDD